MADGPTRGALAELVARATGGELIRIKALGVDEGDDATAKAGGYGRPLELEVREADGSTTRLVYHTASRNSFGHDFRADRAAEMILAYDTFNTIPAHVRALDVGAVGAGGELISLGDAGELYLLTEYAPGSVYADDLRRIATSGVEPGDRERCQTLARYLADLHGEARDGRKLYERTLRDLVGSGEGIFGLIDNFPIDTPGAPRARLQGIEAACNRWRWRLIDRPHRLRRIHGDFHPFNILFDDDGTLALLDTSRGSLGDPANDVTCLAINYPFFALGHPGAWASGLQELWYTFWELYVGASDDRELFEVLAPYLAWRGLVLSNPVWYPDLADADRGAILDFVERTLSAVRFHPELVEPMFSGEPRRTR